jgi:hypothetical protein
MSQYRRRRKRPNIDTLCLVTKVDNTDMELIDCMRHARQAREAGVRYVLLVVDGYNADPRELWEIPEVKELCRRLVALGVISWLDVAPRLRDLPGYATSPVVGFGAWDVWMIARGEFPRESCDVDLADLERFLDEDLRYANAVADDHLAEG